MSLKLQIFDIGLNPRWGKSKALSAKEKISDFNPVEPPVPQGVETFASDVKIKKSNLSIKIQHLIFHGNKEEKYKSGSEALFAVCLAMLRCGFSDNDIASVLTDEKYAISEVAFRRHKSRRGAANWVMKQNIAKAKEIIKSGNNLDRDRGTSEEEKSNLTFERFEDIKLDLSHTALVDNLINHGSLVLLFGETNAGKTFAAVDLALSIAQGKPWLGKKTESCGVVYIATEGSFGIKKRIIAYKKKYGLHGATLPFRLATGTISLRSSTEKLIEKLKVIASELEKPVGLIVIDTLSRALAGGDENSSKEMGDLVNCVDLIRHEIKATILLVHHSGKDMDKGARGHSLLKAAVDTEIRIETHQGSESKKVTTTKQRDYEFGGPMGFKLESIDLQKNSEGKMITSCVVQPLDLEALECFTKQQLTGVALKGFQVLKSLMTKEEGLAEIPLETWRQNFITQLYPGRVRQTSWDAFSKTKTKLVNEGYIEIQNEIVRILSKK